MKQLVQKLKDGAMGVMDVAAPVLGPGMVLVRNHYSLISAGTEASTVSTARKSLVGKAKERPQQVRQVLDSLKQQGPQQTYRAVMKKLDSYSPLGYSSAGEVLDVAPDVRGFAIGDRVACAGAGYANHAEVLAVPSNLCVKLSDDADLAAASYNTLGAIALQGVRQADLRLGETCGVIGLGLLGQLSCLLLRASGVQVVGMDIDARMVELAQAHCCDAAFLMDAPGLSSSVNDMTGGLGVDSVIITAATKSMQPINLAGELLRKRGDVIVVGAVPTGFDREPYYYKKELSLKMSCSYGPGRYDINYEEKGIDYPPAYVRWTENRNMQAFQDLIHSGGIDLNYLTTHRFPLESATEAYDLIVGDNKDYLGILIEYDVEREIITGRIDLRPVAESGPRRDKLGIGFIGAGSYAMSHLLPNLPKDGSAELTGVMTGSGTSSRTVAEKYGFGFVTSDENEIFSDENTNTLFVATRHDSHAHYVKAALAHGHNVFVEKPLCLTETELDEITQSWRNTEEGGRRAVLMIGFNRRFAPLVQSMRESLSAGPKSMIYRVNAGTIPADSWIQDMQIGGGRIIGEVCHFVDLLMYLSGSLPTRVYASCMADPANLQDTINVNIEFGDGSIGTVSYFANGSKSLAKEYFEIYSAGTTCVLQDFKRLEIYGSGKPKIKKLLSQDKGQKVMVSEFIEAAKGKRVAPIAFEETRASMQATFSIIESLTTRQAIELRR